VCSAGYRGGGEPQGEGQCPDHINTPRLPGSRYAIYPRLPVQLFLTIQQLFQGLDGVSQATRCTLVPQPHCPSLRTLRAPPHRLWRVPFQPVIFAAHPHARIFMWAYNSVPRNFSRGFCAAVSDIVSLVFARTAPVPYAASRRCRPLPATLWRTPMNTF
jgi:hypothetical protein